MLALLAEFYLKLIVLKEVLAIFLNNKFWKRSLFKEYSPEVRLRSWVTENGHNIINSIYLQTNCGH